MCLNDKFLLQQIDIHINNNIIEILIPCSDRHFYCVNLNKCHY